LRRPAAFAGVLGVLAVLFAATLPAGARADTPWSIGAAKVDTTPPLFDTAQDLADFPENDLARGVSCPRVTYSGPRLWRFEEPYRDTDGSGSFNYPVSGDPGAAPAPEPFCDYNHNGRWDGIYLSGGQNHQAVPSPDPIGGYSGPAHDPIDARAVAFSDGSRTVVVVSVVAQGIFENYIREARTKAQDIAAQGTHESSCGHIDEMVVSANHNESSPDTIGLYGAPADPTGSFGVNSGIDEYYMDWLDDRIADAAVDACDNRQPASLREVDFPVPAGLRQETHAFPTTDQGQDVAIDPKVRVLQARDASGNPIFTMMTLADHNQDIGQSDSFEESHTMSSDWPGYFHRRLEQDVGGMAMFLAADIGSMEDLITVPAIPGPPCFSGANGCYAQVELTGNTIADDVAAALASATPVPVGPVGGERTEFCAPLENNLFRAAFEAGIFGERQGYTNCQPTGRAGNEVHTSVAVLDVGSDLQFVVNPGEAFPGLMLGSPWGIEDASCPSLDNPPVPTWHAGAKYRFQIGLGDDLIGYEKPAWSFELAPPEFTSSDCNSDPHGHSHSLESESVGPTASNMVAQKLADLLDEPAHHPDPTAEVRLGRYVKADGTLTDAYTSPQDQGAPGHFPTDAVAIWLADPGATTLNATPGQPDSGTIVSLDSVGSFGDRPVDHKGEFMDFDGATQPSGPNLTTRGMLVKSRDGSVVKRYYVNVYPALTEPGSLGAANSYPYAHPIGASPLRVSLVPAFKPCDTADADSTHGTPLDFPSCGAPAPTSSTATVGGQSLGFARMVVCDAGSGSALCHPSTGTLPLPDVRLTASIRDVKCASSLPGGQSACSAAGADYNPNGAAGPYSDGGDGSSTPARPACFPSGNSPSDCTAGADLTEVADFSGGTQGRGVRITDRFNGSLGDSAGTVADLAFPIPLDCIPTTDASLGSTCGVNTTANALVPGVAKDGDAAVWQLGEIEIKDSGPDGIRGNADDELFETQGVFLP